MHRRVSLWRATALHCHDLIMCLSSGGLVEAGSIAQVVLMAEVRDQIVTLE